MSDRPKNVQALIIGANRGIGLELCRQMAARGDQVIATTRRPAAELSAITGVDVRVGVDVTDSESIDALAAELGAGLDRHALDGCRDPSRRGA